MKHTLLTVILMVMAMAVQAQTMNVVTGNVTYQFPVAQAGDMIYSNSGQTLTVNGKAFAVSDITKIYVDESEVKDNHVMVDYNGTSAAVAISGNVASYVSATVSGAHVSISQTNTADVDGDEIEYVLSGNSGDGNFELSGSYKCTITLSGLTLTNPSGAAINITNKKRIQISAKKGTENTLTDGANGAQTGCIYSKGQIQLQGNGTLNVSGLTKHAIKSGDYITVKNLTLNITKAVKDGINCNKYFQMKSGTVSISGVGDDGIQVELEEDDDVTGETEDHEDENSGTLYVDGGTLTIKNSAAPTIENGDVKSAKGLNALCMALNAGNISITMSGNASKAIRCGDGTKSTSGGGGGWGPGGGWGGPGGGMGGRTTWSNVTGYYTQGKPDGTGPTLTITQTGGTYNSSSAKAIKAICAVTIYGGETTINTTKNGAEGLESKTSIDIRGGRHYLKCYDDCINSTGKVYFNGGVTVCYSTGNDAVDSNAGTTGAITIGDGVVFAYMTKGDPDEGLDCDNNNYIQITGTGIGISAGGKQSGTSGTISGAKQGYAFLTKPSSYATKTYYTLADAQGNNLVTYSFEATVKNSLSLITATGMTSKGSYTIKSSTTEPTDATTAFHGLYLGSSASGNTTVATFTAK